MNDEANQHYLGMVLRAFRAMNMNKKEKQYDIRNRGVELQRHAVESR